MTNSYDAHDLDRLQPAMRGSNPDNDRKAAIDGIRYSIAAAERNATYWTSTVQTLTLLVEQMEHQK